MIKKIKIRNYKSLHKLDLDLGSMNVLVGPNMAGKSNIVDVFRFVRDFIFSPTGAGQDPLMYALNERRGIEEVLWKGGDGKVFRIELEAEDLRNSEATFLYGLEVGLGGSGFAYVQSESLSLIKKGKPAELIVLKDGERWLANADGKKMSSAHGPMSSAFQYATPEWDGFAAKTAIWTWRFHQLVPYGMKSQNMTGAGGVLTPHGDNLSAWLMTLQTRFPEEFKRINEVVGDVFQGLKNIITVPTQQGGVYLSSHEAGLIRPSNVWQMSDGELSFIALLSLIYSPLEYGAALYCIEEPENHLHPELVTTLVRLIKQVRQELVDKEESLAQIIVTTHSPILVDQASLDEIIWVEKKEGETVATRPKGNKELRQLIDNKELGLGDLVYSGSLGE